MSTLREDLEVLLEELKDQTTISPTRVSLHDALRVDRARTIARIGQIIDSHEDELDAVTVLSLDKQFTTPGSPTIGEAIDASKKAGWSDVTDPVREERPAKSATEMLDSIVEQARPMFNLLDEFFNKKER